VRKSFLLFMKRPTTWVGIITALMFQVIFSVIWMTGYDGVTDNTARLKLAIVNEDAQFGVQITDGLVDSLPFNMQLTDDLAAAKASLEERSIHMIVHIPSDFSARAADGQHKAVLNYYMNESNPTMTKSVMSSAAAQITEKINSQAVAIGIQQQLVGQPFNMAAEQAFLTAGALSQRVTSEVHSSNIVLGMNNQMVPMMLVLASYVGAMIMGMNLEQSAMALRGTVSRWHGFAVRAAINFAASIVIALVGSSLIAALGGQIEQGFYKLWLFQSLFLLTFMFVSQTFLYILGIGGMLINIIMLSLQLVSSGAMVPRELMSDFYINLGDYLPATYAVDGLMSLLFGGPSIGTDIGKLAIIVVIAVAISMLSISWKKNSVPRLQTAAHIHSNNK